MPREAHGRRLKVGRIDRMGQSAMALTHLLDWKNRHLIILSRSIHSDPEEAIAVSTSRLTTAAARHDPGLLHHVERRRRHSHRLSAIDSVDDHLIPTAWSQVLTRK